MMLIYINGVDRTADVTESTLKIVNQIQQRTDNCSFDVWNGTKPSENQDLKVYDVGIVASIAANVITFSESFETGINKFRAGQEVFVRIGEADEEKLVVQSFNETTLELTLTTTPTAAVVAGDYVGEILFGGTIARVQDENLHQVTNIEYSVTATDYSKIFDKKLVSDTWADVDSRYIINDFVNRSVNYNQTIDAMDYADNTAIQAEWNESGDGANPTVDTTDFIEVESAGVFAWTFAGGTATWEASPTSRDLSVFTNVANGAPTGGRVKLWAKTSDFADITTLKVRLGSDNANYATVTLLLTNTTDWQAVYADLDTAVITGNPVWTATDYAAVVVTETANGVVRLNGLRVEDDGSFSVRNIESTPVFTDFRSPRMKPTALMNLLAKTWEYTWYVDYERDLHFKNQSVETSPYDITNGSENFDDLSIEVDASQTGNRVIVFGGERLSSSRYSQVFEGDGVLREWVLKNKFAQLELTVDNGTGTHAAEVGTNTTNIKWTAHGFATGDHVVNRTRSNAVRQIVVVDADNFTVQTVGSQTNGDTISYFSVAVTDGVEGIDDETLFDYLANSNEKSVRATSGTTTLFSGTFIRMEYYERIPIQVQYTDSASANALKALGLGDGIFDLDPITDRNIRDTSTALAIARAKVNAFSNAVIMGSFKTDQQGLKAGQLIRIQETVGRTIDDTFVIQKVDIKQRGGFYHDYFEYSVTFGTTLWGWIEFMQKLLGLKNSIEVNQDEIVETFVDSSEVVESPDTGTTAIGGFKKAIGPETVESDDVGNVVDTTVPWQYEASVGQALPTRFNLSEYA